MYRVYANNALIYTDSIENMKIFSPKITLELNKTGKFKFTVYSNHPYYSLINKLNTIITVYQDDYLLFRGRVINDEMGFHNEKKIECEGELAFLLDSIQRPYDYSGSIKGFLELLVAAHNEQVEEEKQFTVGNVTVTDPNDYITRSSIEYTNTWEVINSKLIKLLGGYISIRHEDDVNYIDYLEDFNLLASQTVEFAKNLLDMKRIRKGEDIVTGLIPLGAKLTDSEGNETDERLTIVAVNEGLDYIVDEDAVAQYGKIFATNTWDDVTEASNLLRKGKEYLASLIEAPESIELSAADLATIDSTVTSYHIGTYVRVTSNPHGIDQNFLVSKLSIDLLNPTANKLTLGGIVESFTEQSSHIADNIATASKGEKGDSGKDAAVQSDTEPNDKSYMWLDTSVEPPLLKRYNTETETWETISDTTAIVDSIVMLEQNLSSSIAQNSEEILQTVSEQYYIKDETDALISEVSTELEQTKDSLEIRFNNFSASLDDVVSGTDAQFQEISKYIRFEDGNIILGESGNELTLKIANDRISFLQNNSEVAFFSNRKLYVTDGEYTNSLTLGNFAFIPRDNGNLSFKKIL